VVVYLKNSGLKALFRRIIIKENVLLSTLKELEYQPLRKADPIILTPKDKNDCLICKVMSIKHDKPDLVKWIFSSDKPLSEKAKLASLMTGIEFDKEMIACLQDPSINFFMLSE
jgi:hypothetical protein